MFKNKKELQKLKTKIGRNVWLLSFYSVFYNFRLHTVLAVIFYAQVTHSYALALSIFSVAQIAQGIFELPSGIYSDRYGRSNCLRIGAVASLLSIVFYATGFSYWFLVLGAIFDGMNRAFFSGNNDAFLYETLDSIGKKNTYSSELGKCNSNLEFAGFISAIIGSAIAMYSVQLLFVLSIIPQIIGVGLSFLFVEPLVIRQHTDSIFNHLKGSLSLYLTNVKVRAISFASIIGFGLGESSWAFQAVFYNSLLPVWAVSIMMSLNFLASTISFRVSGRLIERFKAINVLIAQEIYGRVLFFIALIYPTVISPLLMGIASLSYGPSMIAKSSILQDEFTDQQRATMSSLNSLIGNAFFAVCAVLIGVVADISGPAKTLLIAQICSLPVLLCYILVKRATK